MPQRLGEDAEDMVVGERDGRNLDELLPKFEALGITGTSLAWFYSYFSGGRQCVVWNETRSDFSDFSDVKYGERQGSILGPILYLVLVADMPDCGGISESDNSCYADDTTIWAVAAVVPPGLNDWEASMSNAHKAVQVALNDVARTIIGKSRKDHVQIADLLHLAGVPSFNELAVTASVMETWKAFRSSERKNGGRNPLGQIIFPCPPTLTFVALSALVALTVAAPANPYRSAPNHPAPAPYTPAPAPYHAAPNHSGPSYHEEPTHYQYGYAVQDEYAGTSFRANEARDGYATNGEYSVLLPDGRTQTVTYTVDDYSGYVADVKYDGYAKEYQPTPHQPAPAYKPAPYQPAPYKPAPYKPRYQPAPYLAICSVQIRELVVPKLFELGSADHILLDCDFDYEESEKYQLDIKWYFNNEPSPFMQWVPGQMKRPQLIGDKFRGHVDLNHSVDADAFKRHRALLLTHPSLELSGIYTCKVSTFLDEDVQHKKLTIYSPASSISFQQDRFRSGQEVNITCAVEGIYPLPRIKLTWGP
eukprot:snap_masked-scaffold125_size330479-processed-gene-1.1 protein:Tk06890 transcript:snap_masked-scaffold125_size330479-processed-gene-1.1-mRNA-1 annotation:"hypothetical protein DAPPUDRAFT_238102"